MALSDQSLDAAARELWQAETEPTIESLASGFLGHDESMAHSAWSPLQSMLLKRGVFVLCED
jgi:hypothetical protein